MTKTFDMIAFFNVTEDCLWSSWSEWSECSKTCSGGERIASRTILQNSFYKGKDCEGKAKRVEVCNKEPCPGTVLLITLLKDFNIIFTISSKNKKNKI